MMSRVEVYGCKLKPSSTELCVDIFAFGSAVVFVVEPLRYDL